jgi:D-glycero-alpha-D-manno-heptose 1-phosphate guanylyltransferase
MTIAIEKYPAVILAGGLGSRLTPAVADKPKVLAPIAGRAFIDILLEKLIEQGLRRFILSVGYKKEQIYEHFQNHVWKSLVTFCPEDTPLGTGGALWQARRLQETGPFFALNGDSYCPVDYANLVRCHLSFGSACTLAVVSAHSRKDFGSVQLDSDGRLSQFVEKSAAPGKGWINAGIYFFEPAIFNYPIPAPAFSLEKDLLPWLVAHLPVFGFPTEGSLMDIGTPERFAQAQEYFRSR